MGCMLEQSVLQCVCMRSVSLRAHRVDAMTIGLRLVAVRRGNFKLRHER